MADADTDDVVGAYERDGYVIVRGVVDDELIVRAGRHVDWLLARHPDRLGEDLGHDLVADDPFWLRLVADPRLIDLAARFVGDDLALFASHYISKPAFSGRPVLWHQDAGYWPLEPMEVVTIWLAVDASTPETGCLRVVPGSHRAGIHATRTRDDVASVFGNESAVVVDEAAAVDIVLAPGDVEIHHPGLLHASGANTSPHRRCGLTIRYIPTSTRITDPRSSERVPPAGRAGRQRLPAGARARPGPALPARRALPGRVASPTHHESCSGATRRSTTRSIIVTTP